MSVLPDPVWPVVVLALLQLIDGILSVRPVPFVARCFEAVNWPPSLWWTMPLVKFAAAAGLVAGIWIPYFGALTCAALIAYFLVAVGMHLGARDLGRNLFVNATGMLVICVATGLVCFVL